MMISKQIECTLNYVRFIIKLRHSLHKFERYKKFSYSISGTNLQKSNRKGDERVSSIKSRFIN